MRDRSSYVYLRLTILSVVLLPLGLLGGCDSNSVVQRIRIVGVVFGEDGRGGTLGLPASVECNGIKAQSSSDGAYSLDITPSDHYECTASAPPKYGSKQALIPLADPAPSKVVVDFSSQILKDCSYSAVGTPEVDCPALPFVAGAIQGKVEAEGSHQPVSRATVRCFSSANSAGPTTEGYDDWIATIPAATTGASGSFALQALPPDSYECVAQDQHGNVAHQHLQLAPGATDTITLTVCVHSCPRLQYHGGRVMHTLTAYLVFWLPQGYTFEPRGGSNSSFESVITQFFKDIGDTRYAGILTQYWDYAGQTQPTIALGGTSVDMAPYEHCPSSPQSCAPIAATHAHPLTFEDIGAEAARAAAANGWALGFDHEVFVFTGYGAELDAPLECALHGGDSRFIGSLPTTIYTVVPDALNDRGACLGVPASPHHDVVADNEISSTSHELFESMSDPYPQGWFAAQNPAGGEIADLCEGQYGDIGPDGANLTLQHGDRYIVQAEWSNAQGSCALAARL